MLVVNVDTPQDIFLFFFFFFFFFFFSMFKTISLVKEKEV